MMQSCKVVWEKSLDTLKKQMSAAGYNTWIRNIEPVCFDGDDHMVLQTSNSVAKNTLNNLYLDTVASAVNKTNGTDYTIVFIEPVERSRYTEEAVRAPEPVKNEYYLNPQYKFDTFVVGNSNNFAYAAAKAVADNPPSTVYNPLFIYGNVGLGKTHLMHAIGNGVKERNPNATIISVTSEAFMNELIQSIEEKKMPQFRQKYRNVDMLMVDDIQFIAGRTRTEEEFFNTFNEVHNSNKQIVIISDRPPKELTTLEERIRSRFEQGLVCDIQPPDLETRVAILRKKTYLDNIDIDENVLTFIAENSKSNIRQLEGALTKVIAYSKLINRTDIDVKLAETALKDIIGTGSRIITVELIQQIVADYYSITLENLVSQRRTAEITYPRQVAMYLCKELTNTSLKTIGNFFGGRDHSTVISACKKIEQDKESKPDTALVLNDLIKRIKN